MKENTEAGNIRNLVEANTKFHRLIHEAGKNPYIRRLIDVIRTFDLKIPDRALQDPEEARRGYEEHEAVFQAVLGRRRRPRGRTHEEAYP